VAWRPRGYDDGAGDGGYYHAMRLNHMVSLLKLAGYRNQIED
jgi:hypothetical protein